MPPIAEVLNAPKVLKPPPPAALCVIDPAVMAAVVAFSAFVMVNEERAVVPTAPPMVMTPVEPALIVRPCASAENASTVPVIDTALLPLIRVEVAFNTALPVKVITPFVVILPFRLIVVPVADRAPKAFVAPTVLPNVTDPVPAFKVRMGLLTTPSPSSVLLKLILWLPELESTVTANAVLSRWTGAEKDRF